MRLGNDPLERFSIHGSPCSFVRSWCTLATFLLPARLRPGVRQREKDTAPRRARDSREYSAGLRARPRGCSPPGERVRVTRDNIAIGSATHLATVRPPTEASPERDGDGGVSSTARRRGWKRRGREAGIQGARFRRGWPRGPPWLLFGLAFFSTYLPAG